MEVDVKSWRALLAAVLLAAGLVWLFHAPTTQRAFAAENRSIELASALSYFVAMLVAAYGATRTTGALRWYLALWAVLCFLFFGEETSWLQHFLRYPTPDWLAREKCPG